jgi:hypothetical protein
MYISNLTKYVRSGITDIPTRLDFVKQMLGIILFVILTGLYPGILGGVHLLLTILMIFIAILNTIILFKISSYTLTLRRCWMLKSVIYVTYVLEFLLIELTYSFMLTGFNIAFLLLGLPIIIIPLWMGIRNNKIFKKDIEYNPKSTTKSNMGIIGFTSGIVGVSLGAAIFKNFDQTVVIIIAVILLSLINSVMSIGLLSMQKVYFAQKYRITFEEK